MAAWRSRIQLKHLLDDDDLSEENVRHIACSFHKRLEAWRTRRARSRCPGRFDLDELESISDEFHSIAVMTDGGDHTWFNNVLAALYDWADAQRVWID